MTQTDKPEQETVHMPCKRGTDRLTQGQTCDGRTAIKLASRISATVPSFKCVKCGFSWVVPTGGQSPI